jgi:hypothetical protein
LYLEELLTSKYAYYQSDPARLSDPLNANLLKLANHSEFLLYKFDIIEGLHSRGQNASFTFESLDCLIPNSQLLNQPEAYSRNVLKIIGYLIARNKVLSPKNPEKKKIADSILSFTLGNLRDIMKNALPRRRDECQLFEDFISSPTVSTLLKIGNLKNMLTTDIMPQKYLVNYSQNLSFRHNINELSPIYISLLFMKFVEVLREFPPLNIDPLMIDFLDKLSIQTYREAQLKIHYLFDFPKSLPDLEALLADPSSINMSKLVLLEEENRGIAIDLYKVSVLATESKMILNKIDQSDQTLPTPEFNLLDKVFAPLLIFSFTHQTPLTTRFFFKGTVIPKEELSMLFSILKDPYFTHPESEYAVTSFLARTDGMESELKEKFLFIFDIALPGYRKLANKYMKAHLPK